MYEVFIKNKSLIISKLLFEKKNYLYLKINLDNKNWKQKLKEDVFIENSETNIYIHHVDAEAIFNILFENYLSITAAGGILSWNEKFLFIKRNGFWDIPKGKCEKNESIEESAIREVQEECEISDIKIERLLCTTLHTYEFQNKKILKKTYWYTMKHFGDGKTSPQKEEGITECKWFSKKEINVVKENTFKSIEYVLLKNKL